MAADDSTRLELLPPELQVRLLGCSPSLQSLYSLIRASPRLYQVFLTSKPMILSHVVRRQIHPEVFADALAAAEASLLSNEAATLENANELMTRYKSDRKCANSQDLIPIHISVRLCQLTRTVNWFAGDFLRYSRGFLDNLDSDIWNHFGLPEELPDDSALSETEQWRLRRSLYRFQLFAGLFRLFPWTAPAKETERNRAKTFLIHYRSWEIEELTSVWDYMYMRVIAIFHKLEDAHMAAFKNEASLLIESALRNGHHDQMRQSLHTVCEMFDRFKNEDIVFSSYRTPRRLLCVKHLLSLRLDYIRTLFEGNCQDQTQFINASSNEGNNLLLEVLYHRPGLRATTREEIRSAQGNAVLLFPGDHLGEASMGWRWVNGFFEDERPLRVEEAESLRLCGYVFWDESRLRASSILDSECV